MNGLRAGLATRIVLHGMVLIVLMAVALLAFAMLFVAPTIARTTSSINAWFGGRACESARSGDLDEEVRRLPLPAAAFRAPHPLPVATSTLYASGLTLADVVGAAGSPSNRPGSPLVVRCVNDPDLYLVLSGPEPVDLRQMGFLLGLLVALAGLGSIPLARSLVAPLRELVAVTDRFGRGELGARAAALRRDEIGDLARAFNTMAANLAARLRSEKELLANVSHELRTPLSRARVVFEAARENPHRAAALLNEIANDLADLERLTDDTLATLRLDFEADDPHTPFRLRPDRVDLVAMARRAIARAIEAQPERDIELEISAALELVPSPVEADPALLARLFANLIENACKYSSAMVTVRVAATQTSFIVEVEDRGMGIEPADLERVFEPFFRAASSRSLRGSGLGLTLCRRIAEAHGGTIVVRSVLSRSTTVSVTLPRADRPS